MLSRDPNLIFRNMMTVVVTVTSPKWTRLLFQAFSDSSRSTPRVANRLLKRARDYAQVHGTGTVTDDIAQQTLDLLEIDALGLEPMDRRILDAIITTFSGGPVGLQALAATTSEEEDTIVEVYEPYLMQLGFLERTPRGRVATERAYEHLGRAYTAQNTLIG